MKYKKDEFDELFKSTIITTCRLYEDEVTNNMRVKINDIMELLNNKASNNNEDLEKLMESDDFWDMFN